MSEYNKDRNSFNYDDSQASEYKIDRNIRRNDSDNADYDCLKQASDFYDNDKRKLSANSKDYDCLRKTSRPVDYDMRSNSQAYSEYKNRDNSQAYSEYKNRTNSRTYSEYKNRPDSNRYDEYKNRSNSGIYNENKRRTIIEDDNSYIKRNTSSANINYKSSRDSYRREHDKFAFDVDENDYLEDRRKRNNKLAQKRKRKVRLIITTTIIFLIVIIGIIVVASITGSKSNKSETSDTSQSSEVTDTQTKKSKKAKSEQAQKDKEEKTKKGIIAAAALQATQYDYDKAIETLKTIKNYENKEDILNLITEYETTRDSCVEYPVDQITHIFFHALLYEPEVSFGPTSTQPDGYNLYMTTVDEFNKIIQSMYDRGYVLVSIYDVASQGEDGTFTAGKIMLPEGKKAFVLSEDDVNYYHAYDNGGIAEKLVIDPDTGKVKTRYIYQDGTVEIGNHDVVPILDEFIEQHPDFSYRGAKGILALTGYNGVLGYRTDPTYNTTEDRDSHQQAWLDAHPDFNYEQECQEASEVAAALKEDGWLLASHSWGHLWQEKMSDNGFDIDAEKWMTRVSSIIGETDIWIYPNGQDVDNETYQNRFNTLYNYGFRYFCPVNSNQYSVRIDSYGLNMGRRNLDGYRMYYDMIDDSVDRLSDLFDVNEVFDSVRPTPVPEL